MEEIKIMMGHGWLATLLQVFVLTNFEMIRLYAFCCDIFLTLVNILEKSTKYG